MAALQWLGTLDTDSGHKIPGTEHTLTLPRGDWPHHTAATAMTYKCHAKCKLQIIP